MIPRETRVTAVVLLAAFTHATWHALLKSQGNLLQTIPTVYGFSALVCALAAPFVPGRVKTRNPLQSSEETLLRPLSRLFAGCACRVDWSVRLMGRAGKNGLGNAW